MIKLTMLSSAEKVKGQGVASAYRELVNLLEERYTNEIDMQINSFRESDITHYHTVDFRFFLSTFFKKKRGVCVGYVHFLPETMEGSLKLPWIARVVFYKYLISFYKRMDEIVVVNPSFIPKLTAYNIPEEKIHYIPNFVSKKTFFPISQAEKNVAREKYGITEDKFTVIGIGQVQHRKGVLDFIEVAKQLPEVQFVWAGGFSFGKITSGYEELKRIYDNPPDNVKFIGIVDRSEMNACINMADIFFMPSYNELFPMAILEAMSSNVPVLLRNLDLYEEILDGYYVKEADNQGFIQAIQRLKTDENYYNEMLEKAKKGAAYYSEDRLAEIWYSFYQKLYTKE
ncbi:glycosyltransferase family 4 protein [Listeria sp. FSL L7-1509]|uniref:Glycosyltransferase family 4 protein n=1 Tax=Listeria immobilis TaxID=2713502 RepID=A0ABR6SW64_9LIST|nr:glycosyltransferase family 4 protein [Listeria immobilis]MBC1482666.1 glycosyltransferase family 4 protein [Listeria immobilis]MBC1507160.1 glycosyltransferase family 4 protein [Listeria immobilis]MBC1509928.1 glycosyltransferase family 4 protein [Listeria immobilis]MBC6302534.1 glycosyltransferase family 4 protein [Listeria immobilis]MBC6312832.1 glycosyltransferase family 4 protein [Listeria immobilis]